MAGNSAWVVGRQHQKCVLYRKVENGELCMSDSKTYIFKFDAILYLSCMAWDSLSFQRVYAYSLIENCIIIYYVQLIE